ncbi:MAG TPA: DUF3775 domain-containing protein [Chromatiales bacterium]|nr:DUF3775 domain-containing protein [Chromatiales bacterium]
MLNINPETVCFVIAKAREFQAKEAVTIPEVPLSPSDDWALQVLADHEDDPSVEEVRAAVADLEPDQQAELVALMWLGRGDYGLDEWSDAVQEARESLTDHTAEYLLGHPLVASYIEDGLNQHGHLCEE